MNVGIREIVERSEGLNATYVDTYFSSISITEQAKIQGCCHGTARRGILAAYEKAKEQERRIIAHYVAYQELRTIFGERE